jgi:hypothetical protein
LWLPFRWNLVFIAVNAINIAVILYERYECQKLSADDMHVYREVSRDSCSRHCHVSCCIGPSVRHRSAPSIWSAGAPGV